jgi:hypothetical protein
MAYLGVEHRECMRHLWNMEDFVHDYSYVEKFRKASVIPGFYAKTKYSSYA